MQQKIRNRFYGLRVLIVSALLALWSGIVCGQQLHFPDRELSVILHDSALSNATPNVLYIQNEARSLMLGDPAFNTKVKYKSNQTFVKFAVNHASRHIPSGYVYKIMYQLQGSSKLTDSNYNFTANDSLIIGFNPDSLTSYQDVQLKVYPKLYNAKLTLVQFYDMTSGSPALVTNYSTLAQNFFIELGMQYQPFAKEPYAPADMGLNLTNAYDASSKLLTVSWAPVATPYLTNITPAQYELEWTYSDNYAADGSDIPASGVIYDFKNNATRIVTDGYSYAIPVVYPKGYIVYRARMVRVDSDLYQYPIYGKWSSAGGRGAVSSLATSSYYQIQAPYTGDSLNWNYTIRFAEEGKYKHVVSYFDGLLKNRQTLTRFNSNPEQLLVIENLYDYEGRPGIVTLPAVLGSRDFRYVPGVSVSDNTGQAYNASDFDKKPATCPDEEVIPPFSNTALGNIYYSSLNPDTGGMQKFVPDAEQYPFVHTRLSPGFADRVDRQGGAGSTLQVGTGHETRYEYTDADQNDLNRLFGLNAGFKNFYSKTVVTDPNGQLSMQIKDYQGRQVATSLIGASVDTSRTAIMFNDEVPNASLVQEDRLANANQLTVGHQKKYNGNYYMDFNALTNIRYEYGFQPFQVCASPYLGLSVKGHYDYSVTDHCGVLKLQRSGELGTTGVTTYSGVSPVSNSDMVSLDQGKYTLDKTLTIATDDIYAAVDSYFAYEPNCTKKIETFIREEVERRDFPCPDSLLDPCAALERQMMEDLFPNLNGLSTTVGKYGRYRTSSGFVAGMTPSIFDYLGGEFAPNVYRYQLPCVAPELSKIVIRKYGNTYTNLGALPVDTFIKIYTGPDRYTIAKALLPLHPEYCRLQNCFVDTFETRYKAMPDAITADRYQFFDLRDVVKQDDQLVQKLASPPISMTSIYDSLTRMFNGQVQMDTLAAQMAFCLNDDIAVYGDAQAYFHDNIVHLDFPSNAVRDVYFKKLRAFYLSNRAKYKSMVQTAGGNACEPCSAYRMQLLPPPRVPVVYNSNGSFNTGPDGLLPLFSTSVQSRVAAAMNQGAAQITDPDSIQALQDSAAAYVHHADSVLNYIAVDSAMSRLVNCINNPSQAIALKDSLIALVLRGEVHNGVFLPRQIRDAITGAGISLTDLCHPYLLSYDFYDDGLGARGSCASNTFYDGVRDFFNDYDINTAIKNVTSTVAQTTPSWNYGNLFAVAIDGMLTGGSGNIELQVWYEDSNKICRMNFFRPGSDTIKLSLRSPADALVGGTAYPMFQTGGSLYFDQVSCYFEDPQAYAEGHIGRFMFRAAITRTDNVGGTIQETKAGLLGWNNGKVEMNQTGGGNSIASCVPCTQFKDYFQAFADTMQLYGGFKADHPLFSRSLRSFMNYSLKKVFSEAQYNRFLQSCAIGDFMVIPMSGGYAQLNFPSGPYNTFDDYVQDIYATDSFYLKAQFMYSSSGYQSVIVNEKTIPFSKLLKMQNSMLGISGNINANNSGGYLGVIYLPAGTNIGDVLVNTGGIFSTNYNNTVSVVRNGATFSYDAYALYNYSGTYPPSSLAVAAMQQSMYDNNISGYFYPTLLPTVNQDYYKPEKQDYLAYTYGMSGLPVSKVLDTLQDYQIESNVYAFSGTDVSYNSPSNPYRFTDLYYAGTKNTVPGWDDLKDIIAYAGTTLGSNGYNPAYTSYVCMSGQQNTIVSGTVPGLTLYRCSDGLYWYRFFGKGDKLYNVFLRMPAYTYKSDHYKYVVSKIIPATGDSMSRRFTLELVDAGNPADVIYAAGSTDFDIACSKKLSDVLLGNDADYHNTEALSGELGGQDNCEQLRLAGAIYTGKINYYNYIDSAKRTLKSAFYAHVMAQVREKLFIEYIDKRFATTLYHYDLAGNLIATVPPMGVHKLDTATASTVDNLRLNNTYSNAAIPAHTKVTRYEYNTVNKPLRETTPDAGLKTMSYDAKGNVVLSQTEKQRSKGLFTYVLYDGQNRITETGEVSWGGCPGFADMPLYSYNAVDNTWTKNPPPNACACEDLTDSLWRYCVPNTDRWMDNKAFADTIRSRTRTQVVVNRYDEPFIELDHIQGMSPQENLRNRIASSLYYDVCPPGQPQPLGYTHASHYSYDAAGNVKTVTQDFPELAPFLQSFKRIDYDYDLWSGKVNLISYNRGSTDQFYQRYAYDDDNRIKKVETSHDGFIWNRDAEYTYYAHGPLARVSLGDQRVQGIDYAYTLQGWLKSVNGDQADTAIDMGRDGTAGTIVPKDAFATEIDYFAGDYTPIGGIGLTTLPLTHKNLYNGNIARQTTDVTPFGALTTAYTYDQLNRIRFARNGRVGNDGLAFNQWYASAYKYDMDGNITMLTRNDGTGSLMDSLVYSYPNVHNNKLADVLDYSSFSQPGVQDLPHYTATGNSRMLYDENGNLTKDLTSNTDSIRWNIYGKTTTLDNTINDVHLRFGYDAAGQRVAKRKIVYNNKNLTEYNTYYVRDASGNILAEYNATIDRNASGGYDTTTYNDISLASHHIYGSSRLGTNQYTPEQFAGIWDFADKRIDTFRLRRYLPWYNYGTNDMIHADSVQPYGSAFSARTTAQHVIGQKQYELVNQLGNVQATVSDKRYLKDLNRDGIRDEFHAELQTAYDYYPFGMLMPGRTVSDTAQHYTTVTQIQLMPKEHTVALWLGNATAVGGATVGTGPSPIGGYAAYGTTGGMIVNFPVTRNYTTRMYVDLIYLNAPAVNMIVRQTVGGTTTVLTSATVTAAGLRILTFTPTTTTASVEFSVSSVVTPAPSAGLFNINGEVKYDLATYSPKYVITQLCNKGKDKYAFGFNGQMKDNEIAGTGNHNTALFWEYDTRLGRRWNLDPKPTIGISHYTAFDNNPIANVDPLGDKIVNAQQAYADRAEQRYENAKQALDNFQGDRDSKEYKSLSKAFRRAGADFKSALDARNETQFVINKTKRYNPVLYDKLDNLKDPGGTPVDVHISTVSSLADDAGKPLHGLTTVIPGEQVNKWQESGNVLKYYKIRSPIAENTVQIQVAKDGEEGLTASHEGGHAWWLVGNLYEYVNVYLKKHPNDQGHDKGNPQEKITEDEEKVYKKNGGD